MLHPIPFLDLVTPHLELERELIEAFQQAVRSATFVGGVQVDAFEHEFAEYCGSKYCVAVSNGTDATRFALVAAGVGPGDAVVTVSHTFVATVEAINHAGAEVEFVDIDPRTQCMCPVALEDFLRCCQRDPVTGYPVGRHSGRPIRAVLPVHLYGQIADMEAILAIASSHGLQVIEDACQAHGAEYRLGNGAWKRAGTLGAAAAFSFYPSKNLGACGEGGAVTTDDPNLAHRVRMLRDHGQTRKYHHELKGFNGRMDAIQAAFLRIKLRHLDGWNERRRYVAARYTECLSAIPDIVTPFESPQGKSVYHLYVIRTAERDALAHHLNASSIGTGLHYPLPVHLQPCYESAGYGASSLPATELAAAQVLSLPMFPGLTESQQRRVTDSVLEFAAAAALRRIGLDRSDVAVGHGIDGE